MKLISLGHCERDSHTVHKRSQRRLTADWLAPLESDCSRMRRRVSCDWLPCYIKATRPVLELFKMDGYFPDSSRKQSFRCWSDANPLERHQHLLYVPKFTVWFAVWSTEVIWSNFYEDENGQTITLTSQRYTEMINEFLAPNLPPNNNLWFEQDGATSHTAVIITAAIRLLFLQRVIPRFGDVPRPPRSPDLTTPDFFFCGGHLKSIAYSRHPVDLYALQQAIRDEIVNIWKETFREFTPRFSSRVHSGGWWPPKRHCTKKWNNAQQI